MPTYAVRKIKIKIPKPPASILLAAFEDTPPADVLPLLL